MAKYRIYDIRWDTDGEEIPDLPTDDLVNSEYLDVEDDENINEVEEAISEYLSDEYGFCHFGFSFKRVSL